MKISQLNEELMQDLLSGRDFFNTIYQRHGIKLMMASENLDRLASLVEQNNTEKQKIIRVKNVINKVLFTSFKLNESLAEKSLSLTESILYLKVKKQEINQIELNEHENFKLWNDTDIKVIELIYKKKNFVKDWLAKSFINKVTMLKRRYNSLVELYLYDDFVQFLSIISKFNNDVLHVSKKQNDIVVSINSIIEIINIIKNKIGLLKKELNKIIKLGTINLEFLIENINYFLKQEENKFSLDTYNKYHRDILIEFEKSELNFIDLENGDKEIEMFMYINNLSELLIKMKPIDIADKHKNMSIIRLRENMFNFLNNCMHKEYFYSSKESQENIVKIMSEVFSNFFESYSEEDDRVVKEMINKSMSEYFLP